VNQIVNWIYQVAPSLVRGGRQSEEDTGHIIHHLLSRGAYEELIAKCLAMTAYKWTVSREYRRIALALASAELGRTQNTPPPQTRMNPRSKYSSFSIKQRAAELRAIFDANPHNPAVQKKAMQDLLALLNMLDDPGTPDPMPGRGRMETDRERIQKVQNEILLTSRELGRQIVLYLGPGGLQRRQGTMPMPEIGRFRIVVPESTRQRRRKRRAAI
jgi:hypothetical protein